MPASDFHIHWPQAPLFQVYGTKRKHGQELPRQQPHEQVEDMLRAKRRCVNAVSSPPQQQQQPVPMQEINHNHMQDAYALAAQQQLQSAQQENHFYMESQEAQAVQNHPENAQPPRQQQQLLQSANTIQDCHPMDMCGETFSGSHQASSHYNASEMDSRVCAMDDDCVPDPYQYSPDRGGETSPASGRIRCYCKPSWEGMMGMRPYVSDYY